MSTAAPRRSASARRARYGLATLGIVVCAVIWLALANLIALDPRLRLVADATSTGAHRLAPRTRQVLDSLPAGYEIVIAGAAAADPDVRRRVADVLDAIARSGRLTVTWIDDPSGPDYAALTTRLIGRDRARIDAASSDLTQAAEELNRAAALLDRADLALKEIESAIAGPAASSARQRLAEYAGVARLLAADARSAADSIRAALSEPSALGVPAIDRAASVARRSLARLASELQSLSSALTDLAAADSTPREAQLRARGLTQQLALGRDPLAIAADRATALAIPDLVRVSRVLEGTQTALVISPDGLGAIAFDTLFPPSIPQTVGGARADVGAMAEDLLTSAIASLASPTSPIIVLVHAEDARLLDQNAIPALLGRLALRRIDVVEWRIVAEPEPTGLAALNPDATRPIVYVVLGSTSAAQASGPSNLTGPDRVQRLGAALRRLTSRGLPILLSITPSTLPAFGGTDETTAFLPEFGLAADSGRPLLTERILNGRRVVETDRLVTTLAPTEPGLPHPILNATATLAIGLRWSIPLSPVSPPQGVRATVTPLIDVTTPATWAESQWLQYWQVRPEQRASVTQPPTPDPSMGDDTSGRWTIAAAVERTAPGLPAPQRLVAIGSSGWFFDSLAAQTEVVGGRVVPTLPGNTELFEAAVYWLARQEEFIARSAASGSVPTVRALTPTQSSIINWLVLAVMPLGTLGAGILWRLARG